MEKPKRGKFIVLEGIDGSGKSTQAKMLYDYLNNNGVPVVLTEEPWKESPITDILREHYLSGKRPVYDQRLLIQLFMSAQFEHLVSTKNGILKLLDNGINVICDRWLMSTYAYNVSLDDNYNIDKDSERLIIDLMNINNMIIPDMTIFIDTQPVLCMNRIKARSAKAEIFENLKKLSMVYFKYFVIIDKFRNPYQTNGKTWPITIVHGDDSANAISAQINDIWDKYIHDVNPEIYKPNPEQIPNNSEDN